MASTTSCRSSRTPSSVCDRQRRLSALSISYSKLVVYGAFMWARVVSDFKMLETEDPIYTWRERMLDLYDAMPRNQPGFPF